MAVYQIDKYAAIAADGTRTRRANFVLQSTDSKPTGVGAGSKCFEGDTKKVYMYDGSAWREVTASVLFDE